MPGPHAPAAEQRPQPDRTTARRTFVVEVRVDGDPAGVLTTRVTHLDTQESQGWAGWDAARLLRFLEPRVLGLRPRPDTPALRQGRGAGAEGARGPAGGTDCGGAVLHPHRFGVVRCAAVAGGAVRARLRMDPGELGLAPDGEAVVRVKLLGEVLGARPQVLDVAQARLDRREPLILPLSGRPAEPHRLHRILATVLVLVSAPSGPPAQDLGATSLERI